MRGKGIIVIGSQWGDEGKGKVTDFVCDNVKSVARYQGGNNAGHTVVVNGQEFKFHLLPSGVVREKTVLIGSGVVLDPRVLVKEMEKIDGQLKLELMIDPRTHIILPYHNHLDGIEEAFRKGKKIGTTGRGIGPCYADKASRCGIRFQDLVDEKKFREKLELNYNSKQALSEKVFNQKMPFSFQEVFQEYKELGQKLKHLMGDVSIKVEETLSQGENVLFEGAQGTFLDNNYGTYPFVTSSNPIVGGALTGIGMRAQNINQVIGIVKAYTTRVGEGPFVTELTNSLGNEIREKGAEYGTTTGRPRRVGWLDLVLIRTANRLNGFTELAITKFDVLNGIESLMIATSYDCKGKTITEVPTETEDFQECKPNYLELKGFNLEDKKYEKLEELPVEAREYLKVIEKELNVPIKLVSYGADREKTIRV
ncbi:MAG: adenylosuccinate synthase [archaeon]